MKLFLYNFYKIVSSRNKKHPFISLFAIYIMFYVLKNPKFNDYNDVIHMYMLYVQMNLRLRTLQMLQN